MTHDEMIEVIAAHRDGKAIQIQDMKQWQDTTVTLERLIELIHAHWRFRVKPEPRRLWIPDVFVYTTREDAVRAFPQANIIEVVEVVQ